MFSLGESVTVDSDVPAFSMLQFKFLLFTGGGDTIGDNVFVFTQTLPPEMGARFRFWASRPSLPAAGMALLFTKAVDVE